MNGYGPIGFLLDRNENFVSTPYFFEQGIYPKMVEPIAETWVTIQVGYYDGLNAPGGYMPGIALWDEDGNRMGRYKGRTQIGLWEGDSRVMKIRHDDGRSRKPGYVLVAGGFDALCVAMVQVSTHDFHAALFGDTGYKCGQSWYWSKTTAASGAGHKSRCVWLHGNAETDKNARSVSFHVGDMVGARDKIDLYNRNSMYVCSCTRRFAYRSNMAPKGVPPFYKPPLLYYPDGQDPKREGADREPDLAFDYEKYDMDVWVEQGEPGNVSKIDERDEEDGGGRNRTEKRRVGGRRRQGSNMNPDHLVVTEIAGQTATAICEDGNSQGFDIVSYIDNKFCDLSERKLYDICTGKVTSNCFDADTYTIVASINARGERSEVPKGYKTKDHWK
ncbi:hypothetical protein C8034_v010949 [Colletotrichum sidae]|uniref:Uncharacterized protein n=1 Tax=Colletotrichum sidae TaxID=1347389 RepID=A0A4R8TJ56_9PEZI|nr:hypothetical protein C8034_v010949 [Colletotrichum sidae]